MFYIPTLTIAGSDCSGGAGVQADIKTMSALGCYAASVITSVTVQNTQGVSAIHSIPPEIVEGQIRAVMDDIHPLAVKIGMVNDASTIRAIAETLKSYTSHSKFYIILDPVMVSTSGCRLMQQDALEIFERELLPLATLITPNIPEAEVLSGKKIDSIFDEIAIKKILSFGTSAVLLKGGHLTEKTDGLYIMKNTSGGLSVHSFKSESVDTNNTHGTGCTLSSAITSFLAISKALHPDEIDEDARMVEAIKSAKNYITEALKAGADVKIGEGHGPVNHFYQPKALIKVENTSSRDCV